MEVDRSFDTTAALRKIENESESKMIWSQNQHSLQEAKKMAKCKNPPLPQHLMH